MSEEKNIQNQKSEGKAEDKEQSQPEPQPQTLNVEPQTTNMETHAHHLHKAPGQGWRHYFFEFFMLFLAVTLGFFVENQREHFVESKREKLYIQSLLADLRQDTAVLNNSIYMQGHVCSMIDTLILLLKSQSLNNATSRVYYLARQIPYSQGRFSINSKTFDQLKSSGNLRLIRKINILDSIAAYYQDAINAAIRGPLDMNFQTQHDLFLSLYKLFDAGIFQQMIQSPNPLTVNEPENNPPLLTNDPLVINEICTRYHFMYGTKRVMIMDNERLLKNAINLILLLQKEYGLN